jgi:ABC-type oligopeptide transport system substrate-binding subunit
MRRIAYRYLAAISLLIAATVALTAATRPHYGGTLRVMLQSAPNTLDLSANAANTSPAGYWDLARTLSLIGDTLVTLDAQARAHPALAVTWQSDDSARHWQFTLRRGSEVPRWQRGLARSHRGDSGRAASRLECARIRGGSGGGFGDDR